MRSSTRPSVRRPKPTLEDFAYSRLLAFNRYMWPGFLIGRHHRLLAQAFEQLERREIRRLLLTLPPRHGKSEAITNSGPAWYLGRNPSHKVMVASYAQQLANDFGRKNRNKMEDPRYWRIFPGVRLARDSTAVDSFQVIGPDPKAQRGEFNAVGIEGGATGKGADLLLIDDPVKNREQAESRAFSKRILEWYEDVAFTRLSPGGVQVVIMTRWNDGDLAGHVLALSRRKGVDWPWVHLNLPALAIEGEEDALGRSPGEALWPEFYNREDLEGKRAILPARTWSSLYQGRPVPREGFYVNKDWFDRRRWTTKPFRPWRIIQSWDTARKDAEWNDPTVCTTWAEDDRGIFLLDVWRERVRYPGLKAAVQSQAELWGPDLILVEDSANGTAVVHDLETTTPLPFLLVSTDGLSKEVRLESVTGMMQGGRVWLPEHAAWLPDFELELTRFPAAAHDDQVDSVSQALRWFLAREKSRAEGQEEAEAIAEASLHRSMTSALADY
jgi:predicted phage terminase large subunit-like protein